MEPVEVIAEAMWQINFDAVGEAHLCWVEVSPGLKSLFRERATLVWAAIEAAAASPGPRFEETAAAALHAATPGVGSFDSLGEVARDSLLRRVRLGSGALQRAGLTWLPSAA